MTSTIYQTKTNNKIFTKQVKSTSKLETSLKTLHTDFLESSSISITNYKKYSIVNIKTKNSIYGISNPYVTWLVLKKNNTLTRFESARKIKLPIQEEGRKYIFMDLAEKNCDLFQVKLSKNMQDILIYINIAKQNPILFEIHKL